MRVPAAVAVASFCWCPKLLALTATVNAQIVSYMNVCYEESATEKEAQDFCRSVPDCYEIEETKRQAMANANECFMRCDDPDGESYGLAPYDCAAHGMVCHHEKVCLLPPKPTRN